MKIVIAPDSFKGTLSSCEVCEIIAEALTRKYPEAEILTVPTADGGEGTCEAYLHIFGGERVSVRVKSPLGRTIEAQYAMLGDKTAVIETAAASGLCIEKQNDPMRASTFGTGQLFLHALSRGAQRILLGLGGSAATDGGTGFLSALGARFLGSDGKILPPGGEALTELDKIDLSCLDKRAAEIPVTVLCDVKNPLFGENGAAKVFAPQKGADKNQVQALDRALRRLAEKTEQAVHEDFSRFEGAGAAGGTGFCLRAFLGAELQSGIEQILTMADFERLAENADLIITGEGKMDSQSFFGKVPFGVAERSGDAPVTAVVGIFEGDRHVAERLGISHIIETNPKHLPFEQIKSRAKEDLTTAAGMIEV